MNGKKEVVMKQFLLFTGVKQSYGGGWQNFSGDFDSAQEARREGDQLSIKSKCDWMHVVDTEMKKLVLDYDDFAGGRWKKYTGRLWIDA